MKGATADPYVNTKRAPKQYEKNDYWCQPLLLTDYEEVLEFYKY